MYSSVGASPVEYVSNAVVLPTAPSPTTTILIDSSPPGVGAAPGARFGAGAGGISTRSCAQTQHHRTREQRVRQKPPITTRSTHFPLSCPHALRVVRTRGFRRL